MVKQKGIPKQWQEKICPRCGILLTENNHIPSKIKHNNYVCKDCTKKWRQENKDKIKVTSNQTKNKERRKLRYQENKEKYQIYYQKNKEKYKVRYQKNKEQIKASLKKLRLNQRKSALKLLGGKCVYCGCDRYEVLEINHINGRDKKGERGYALIKCILNGNVDLSELEVTCSICNIWHYITKLRKITDGWTIKWK